ncbi:hormogonium polysaccharide biosynthesis protein HpsJ [Nodosilinea nodulosa]|uniref:hormogonium polysaccharide biosynthesis protein HpsJ n=1 Tax=Nodosilinea nodulosa TaxID=416001 RepID=UPI000318A785|nr:HpsJ family protein [Nodosilinea nodulosa]
MTSEPAVTSPVASPLAAIALKVAGAIAILSALLDFLILLIPPNLTNVQWQLATTTQFVDRGIVPLIGIALLLAGLWVDSSIGRVAQPKSLTTDLRFWACALASVLGLVYLLLILLHLNAVRLSTQTALAQVGTEAGDAATQLQQRLSTELSQQQSQLGTLLQSENKDLLNQAIQSGQLPPDIEKYRDDPDGLTQFLQQRADQAKQQIEAQIGTRRAEAERRVKTEAWRSGVRISVTSLLLSAGFSIIGWLGLKRLLSLTRSA